MSLAYVMIAVSPELYDHYQASVTEKAKTEAIKKFEVMARESNLTKVTLTAEPRVMTYPELIEAFPDAYVSDIVVLRFTADIS